MTQSINMMRTRPPIAMPAIAPMEIFKSFEAALVFDVEGVADDVVEDDDEGVVNDVAEDDDEGVATCAMRVGA
jgi:hypothetical protein